MRHIVLSVRCRVSAVIVNVMVRAILYYEKLSMRSSRISARYEWSAIYYTSFNHRY